MVKKYSLNLSIENDYNTIYGYYTTVGQMNYVFFSSCLYSDTSGVNKEPIEWLVLDRQATKTTQHISSEQLIKGKQMFLCLAINGLMNKE